MKQVARDFQTLLNLPFGTLGISMGPLVVPGHRAAAKGVGGFAGARSGKKPEIRRWLLGREGGL